MFPECSEGCNSSSSSSSNSNIITTCHSELALNPFLRWHLLQLAFPRGRLWARFAEALALETPSPWCSSCTHHHSTINFRRHFSVAIDNRDANMHSLLSALPCADGGLVRFVLSCCFFYRQSATPECSHDSSWLYSICLVLFYLVFATFPSHIPMFPFRLHWCAWKCQAIWWKITPVSGISSLVSTPLLWSSNVAVAQTKDMGEERAWGLLAQIITAGDISHANQALRGRSLDWMDHCTTFRCRLRNAWPRRNAIRFFWNGKN